MADQLLSIEDSTLTAIANAIRSKGGTSAALSFPNGFVSALQAIETVATVTPKIAPPSTKELTPSDTSFAIEQGYHTKSTIVSISTTTGSATPSSTEQTYYPPNPYNFFSSFWVDGIGSGYKVQTGTKQGAGGSALTIDDFDFTPSGIICGVCDKSSNTSSQVSDFAYLNNVSHRYAGYYYYSSSKIMWHRAKNAAQNDVTFSYGEVKIKLPSSYKFANTFYYVVWGR